MQIIKRIALYAVIIAVILVLASSCGEYYNSGFDAGYRAGYNDCEEELRDNIEEDWYDAGYSDGYSDAEYDFYDTRFVEGYESGYSDSAAGKDHVAKPRGDKYIWFSIIGEELVYHNYTLPLPPCATAQTTDGFLGPIDDVDEGDIPCSICRPIN